MQNISFKADNHRITTELYNYVRDLLATGHYTNKEVAEITGLNRNIVKDIDKKRLEEKYTINGSIVTALNRCHNFFSWWVYHTNNS